MSEIEYRHGLATAHAYEALDASVHARADGDFGGAERLAERSRWFLSRTAYPVTLAWYAAAYSMVRISIDYGNGPLMIDRGWAREALKEMAAASTPQAREVIGIQFMQMTYRAWSHHE